MKNLLTLILITSLFASCKKDDNVPFEQLKGYDLTVISDGNGERIVLSTFPTGKNAQTIGIKPQSDTVTFKNVTFGKYMVSVSRVRHLVEMGDSDTTVYLYSNPTITDRSETIKSSK